MIDFAEIQYIDSAALGILLEMSKLASAKKVQFGLIHVDGAVKKVIEVTKLDKVLKIFD
jgi:anti-anti-sigma factor